MLIRPDLDDFRVIGYHVGKIVFGMGVVMLLPVAVALTQREWNDATAILLGAALAVALGRLTELGLRTRAELQWSHGMVTVATAWLIGPLLLAVPFYLSGHFGSFVDAYFDAMSGLTATGLTLLQDLDHVGDSINLLRHLSHFAGGQGIVLVVLSVFTSGGGGQISTMYVGEGRAERLVPNVIRTARLIFVIALSWMVVGTTALVASGMHAGLSFPRALFHGVNLFMSAFDTAGFSPTSVSVGYYHSPSMELVLLVLMVTGTLSFPVHYLLWRRRRRTVTQNLETRTLALTIGVLTVAILLGLARSGTYLSTDALFRKGFFTAISAHTGSGFVVTPGRLFVTDWGVFAPAAMVVAMALGGMAGSTTGGIKAIRIGLAAKSVLREIRRAVAPPSTLVVASYQGRHRQILRDDVVRSAITIFVLFMLTYLAGAIVGVYFGYPFDTAVFESTSAASNAGLSTGLLAPGTELPLKLTYLVQMYAGRLEFMAVFAFLGYFVALARGKSI